MRFLRLAAALGFVLFVVFLTTASFSSGPATVRIANATFSENVAALWIGADMGFFKKHGANVEVLHCHESSYFLSLERLCRNSVHGSRTSSRTELPPYKFK